MAQLEQLKFESIVRSDEDKESSSKMNFDYLLSMPLYSLTKDKIEELQKKITEKKEQIKHLEGLTEADIWLQELEAFEEVYRKELTSKGYPMEHPSKTGIPVDSHQ